MQQAPWQRSSQEADASKRKERIKKKKKVLSVEANPPKPQAEVYSSYELNHVFSLY